MEYCEKGELFDYIVEKERLNPIEASMFFYQLINGVSFAHRDLKPETFLLTKDQILKSVDFGLCHDFNNIKKMRLPLLCCTRIIKRFPRWI